MLRTRLRRATTVLVTAVALATALPTAAMAAAAPADKPQVMSSWTQPTAASYAAWNAGRQNQAAWAAYGFDWTTDYCSSSPDQPLGFDFRLSCHHHDWGYRNYKLISAFDANKSRLDDTFYADLRLACDQYAQWQQPACDGLAWTYYQAVSILGSAATITEADLDQARRSLSAARARHTAAIS